MSKAQDHEEILASFSGAIEPVKVSPTYQIALGAVALAMVLLPLIYLALIGATGWAVYRYAIDGLSLFKTISSAKGAFFAYAMPLFVGIVALLFMIKPLFARREEGAPTYSLNPDDEPTLFAFVQRLCQEVGAPMPSRIDVDCQVNASASFRRGMLSLFGHDLVLTIGMPLARGLSLEQLAGVLAHEFGHFAQGAGMRLSYVVRWVSAWFARVVYERDRWDHELDKAAKEADGRLFIWLTVQLARMMVWLTRRILWVLMQTGHAISCFLLRQMEFDADRYEARLVGAPTFAATARDLTLLGAGQQMAMQRLNETWSLGHLASDLPDLITTLRGRLEAETVSRIDESRLSEKTGAFDTHPADADRVASAERETGTPIFQSELPAKALFSNFESLAQAVSRQHLESIVGDEVINANYLPTQELLTLTDQAEAERGVLERFAGASLDPTRPLPWPDVNVDMNPEESAREIAGARQAMAASSYASALEDWQGIEHQRLRLDAAQEILDVGNTFDAAAFEVEAASAEALTERHEILMARAQRLHDDVLDDYEHQLVRRLRLALGALAPGSANPEDPEPASEEAAERDRLLPALESLNGAWSMFSAINHDLSLMRFHLQYLAEDSEASGDRIMDLTGDMRGYLDALRESSAVPCPFDFQPQDEKLGEWIVPQNSAALDWPQVMELANASLDRCLETKDRLLRRLAVLAEEGEARLGLDPVDADGQEAA